MRKLTLYVVVSAVAMLGVSGGLATAFAAKGGGKGGGGGGTTTSGSSLSVVMVNDVNHDSLPNWGDSVSFKVTTTATTEPHVNLECRQNGVVVYGAVTGYYASYPWPWTQTMQLSSQSWAGGAADCTATLSAYSGVNVTTLATLKFHVNA